MNDTPKNLKTLPQLDQPKEYDTLSFDNDTLYTSNEREENETRIPYEDHSQDNSQSIQ